MGAGPPTKSVSLQMTYIKMDTEHTSELVNQRATIWIQAKGQEKAEIDGLSSSERETQEENSLYFLTHSI